MNVREELINAKMAGEEISNRIGLMLASSEDMTQESIEKVEELAEQVGRICNGIKRDYF